MGGGLMQLVAYGAQDIYLTGNPQITFFKVVYRRHTNFSMESIKQTLDGSSTSVSSGDASCTISRNGDLVYKVYVAADSSTATNGSALISQVELEIGGQLIDRHYQEWNEVWNELTTTESKCHGLKSMLCEVGTAGVDAVETIQIPLNFWFCRNPGLSLPLIALQYHEVKLTFTWGDAGATGGLNPVVWCDYIYLDTDERRRFAQVSHEYLIEQLQRNTYTEGAGDKKLNFNHPVKELIWVNDHVKVVGAKYQLKLNGHDRFERQTKEYFTLRQAFDHHTAVPRQNLPTAYHDFQLGARHFEELVGHTADGSYVGKAAGGDVVGDGQLFINGTSVVLQGVSAPSITSAYNSSFTLAIEVLTAPTNRSLAAGADQNIVRTRRAPTNSPVGRIYTVTVSSVSVATNKITFTTSSFPTSTTTLVLGVDGQTGGTYGVYRTAPNTHSHSEARTSKMTKEINVYSFALKPEEHQPSGTCNFSRIDNAQLNVHVDDGGGRIYAVNYNVLRIMSGMGGLAYSN